ncbi:Ig-like domain-containing protein, partial [Streptomyces sp. WMMB 322]|uniref:Ig-like domain-containing protein n=1 Tax=Streptomyces sp. WMMB 322 TaxID=1286821 RepID=UPI001585EC86
MFDFGDGNLSGPVPLVSGVASTTHAYATTSGSPFTVTATYGGSANFSASVGADTHGVNAAGTSTAVAGAPDPSVVGESVTFTATVSAVSPGSGTPMGSVVFDFGDGNVSAPVPLSGGVATISHAYATVGGSPFTVTATYGGSANFSGSSGVDSHVVNAAGTSTAVVGAPDPSVVGESVTFTATVSAVSPGGGTPTGSVVFDFGDGNLSGPVPLVSGAAST